MNDLLNRVIAQFDSLIPFLAISREDIFDLINREKGGWFPQTEAILPDSYAIYRTQINHSAFLLGYSYFEAFLADLVREIYLSRPRMLPKDKRLAYGDILKTSDYRAILELMIEREIIDLFYQRMDEVIKYFEEKLNLEWLPDYRDETVITSLLRNCIVHNLNRPDFRLSQASTKYKDGDIIELSASDVHSYGIKVRQLVRHLYSQAEERHFNS